ncbi:MAG: creatininase family protein [Pseudomonadota bacterium]
MTKKIWWTDFKAPDFASIDPMKTIAMLPIAAVEQHGPHLPLGTDAIINRAHIDMLIGRLPDDIDLRILPVQAVGKSNEHLWAAGTVTHTAENLIGSWVELGLSVARAGLRKLVIVNSHGGNEEIMGIVARELRVRADMLVVKTGWGRFPPPEGLISDQERRHGIHGGDVETSLMLYFRPDLVDMREAQEFVSIAAENERDFRYLRPTGTNAYSWIASDLNPSGAVGNAAIATAEKGQAIAEETVARMLELLLEVQAIGLPAKP